MADQQTADERIVAQEELLANRGREAITWVEDCMPGLKEARRRYGPVQILHDCRIAGFGYLDAKTAVFIETLIALGAEVQWSNAGFVYNDQEERAVAAALKQAGVSVFLCGNEMASLKSARQSTVKFPLAMKPNMFLFEDVSSPDKLYKMANEYAHGCNVMQSVYNSFPNKEIIDFLADCITNCRCQVYNESARPRLSSYYGWDNLLVQYIKESIDTMPTTEKLCIVVGYQANFKSCLLALREAGVPVLITEPDPILALEAAMDNFKLVTSEQARKLAKVFVIATECHDLILNNLCKLKDDSLVCILSGFNKLDKALESRKAEKESTDKYLTRYKLENGNHAQFLDVLRLDSVTNKTSFASSYSYTFHLLQLINLFTNHEKYGMTESATAGDLDHLEKEAARLHLSHFSGLQNGKLLQSLSNDLSKKVTVSVKNIEPHLPGVFVLD